MTAAPQPGDWWCGRCRAFNWRRRWTCINCGKLCHWARIRILIAAALALALVLALGACAPRTLRMSACQAAAPGLKICTFHYEGDE